MFKSTDCIIIKTIMVLLTKKRVLRQVTGNNHVVRTPKQMRGIFAVRRRWGSICERESNCYLKDTCFICFT